jgi:hypothetical protein
MLHKQINPYLLYYVVVCMKVFEVLVDDRKIEVRKPGPQAKMVRELSTSKLSKSAGRMKDNTRLHSVDEFALSGHQPP